MMALGAVFHGAQMMLDLAVAGLSLVVALGLFAVVTTVLCSAAFLHHSQARRVIAHPPLIHHDTPSFSFWAELGTNNFGWVIVGEATRGRTWQSMDVEHDSSSNLFCRAAFATKLPKCERMPAGCSLALLVILSGI